MQHNFKTGQSQVKFGDTKSQQNFELRTASQQQKSIYKSEYGDEKTPVDSERYSSQSLDEAYSEAADDSH